MSKELEKKNKDLSNRRINWSFTAAAEILKEIREYAKKYDMSVGEYFENLHKRYKAEISGKNKK